jgi:RHS repeat-associated protein
VKEPGYAYLYVSNENPTMVDVYYDDITITHTPTNIVQYNEYYPFGLQAGKSWTRDNNKNDFLYNEGTELNRSSGWYETPFRNYDPALGRFVSVDPLAEEYGSLSAYHYAGNNPIMINDPTGADYGGGYDNFGPGGGCNCPDQTTMTDEQWMDWSRPGGEAYTGSADHNNGHWQSIPVYTTTGSYNTKGDLVESTSTSYLWHYAEEENNGPEEPGLFWDPFNKSDLLNFAQQQCNCEGGKLEDYAGKLFESTFNSFMKAAGDISYIPNTDPFDTDVSGRQAVVPDGIATSQVLLGGRLIIVPNGSWYEVKATTSTITASSFGNQAGGLVNALAATNLALASQGVLYLTFATTHDARLSNQFAISAKIQTGVNVGQYKAMYRMVNGAPMITFYSTAASSAYTVGNFSPFRVSVPLGGK